MNNTIRRMMAAGAVLAMVVAGYGTASAQTAVKPATAQVSQPDMAQVQLTCRKAGVGISSSVADKQALLSAVRTKNTDIASQILLKNGFTAQQLKGAAISLQDNTGGQGTAAKIKITVNADCCPLKIVIIISF